MKSSKSCTDLGEEHPKQREKCKGPEVEACLLHSRNNKNSRDPAEGTDGEG